jgi:hypothetical protein
MLVTSAFRAIRLACALSLVLTVASGVSFAADTPVNVRITGLQPDKYSQFRVAVEHSAGKKLLLDIGADGVASGTVADLAESMAVTARFAPRAPTDATAQQRMQAMKAYLEFLGQWSLSRNGSYSAG